MSYEPAPTHPAAVATWARRDPATTAVRWKEDGHWQSWTRLQLAIECGRAAVALTDAGLMPGDRVAIVAPSSPLWFVAAMGAQGAGGVTVGGYATSAGPQLAFLLGHSGSRFVFTGDAAITRRVLSVADGLPSLERVIAFDVDGLEAGERERVVSFEEFLASSPGGETALTAYEKLTGALDEDQLATIVYTSGTTGEPKGALHSYRTINQIARDVVPAMGYRPDDDYVVYLPLNHTAEQTYTIVLGSQLGWTLHFAQSMATLADDLVEIRPTVMFGVPRIFEKVRDQIRSARGGDGGAPLRPFGLDRLRVAVCGGAPLAADLVTFFAGHGLRMCNTYGMTEAGAISSAWDREPRPDTCGGPYPGVSIKVAPGGEALVRSSGLCLGYYNDAAATAELFTDDGFLRTGDIIELTPSGDVRVIDRKKDIIITSGGKNISPSGIQHALARSPYINQAVLVGNDRRYVAALLELAPAALAERLGHEASYAELIDDPAVLALLDAAVTEVNATLSPPEQVKRWAVLPQPLLPTDPEVTPTMKVKRGAFERRYAELIESLYE